MLWITGAITEAYSPVRRLHAFIKTYKWIHPKQRCALGQPGNGTLWAWELSLSYNWWQRTHGQQEGCRCCQHRQLEPSEKQGKGREGREKMWAKAPANTHWCLWDSRTPIFPTDTSVSTTSKHCAVTSLPSLSKRSFPRDTYTACYV